MEKRGWLTILVIFGGLFLVLLVFSLILAASLGEGGLGMGGKRVGVIEIKGPITGSKETLEDFRRFERDDSVKAIVVRIDTPGGAVAPSQELFQKVKELKEEKPLVVSMGSTAASGGYYIACGADTIFANPGTITGSIGVITQLFNIQKLIQDLDIEVNTVKSGEYKNAGSPFKEFTDRERAYFKDLIMGIYRQFIEDVAEARKLEVSEVEKYADGRVFTGQQAKEMKLVDKLGSFDDAVDFVKEEAGLEGDIKLKYPPKEEIGVLGQAIEGVSKSVSKQVKSHQTPMLEYRYVGP